MLRVPHWLERWRLRMMPEELGWGPLVSLIYLGFLFMPLLFLDSVQDWLLPTLLTLPVFLLLYFRALRQSGDGMLPYVLALAALGYALSPINPNANVYLIYAAALMPFMRRGLRTMLLGVIGILLVYLAEVLWLGLSPVMLFVAVFVAIASAVGNHFYFENRQKQAALRLSHDEIRRLAASAERERIGRDLHDLLGHTLSLVALKSELASRLCDRDPLAARREIDEVQRVAREALAQVRSAVSGIRSAGIAAEMASARLLLESENVRVVQQVAELALPVELETVLALVIREAVTNVHRHARAREVRIELDGDADEARLSVADDGRGGTLVPGNGLSGMRERVDAVGGSLKIDSTRGHGTCLTVRLPLPRDNASAEVIALQPRLRSR